jgi:uncharacterized protein (DUF302 family)
MYRCILLAWSLLLWSAVQAAEVSGLVTKPSKYPVAEASERLGKTLKAAGMTVFAEIDHAAAAEKAGLPMPTARVVIFGNPKGGTPMMVKAPSLAIDLPMKILVWEDAAGKAWVSYNTAAYVANRHGLKGMDKQIQGLDAALLKLTADIVESN